MAFHHTLYCLDKRKMYKLREWFIIAQPILWLSAIIAIFSIVLHRISLTGQPWFSLVCASGIAAWLIKKVKQGDLAHERRTVKIASLFLVAELIMAISWWAILPHFFSLQIGVPINAFLFLFGALMLYRAEADKDAGLFLTDPKVLEYMANLPTYSPEVRQAIETGNSLALFPVIVLVLGSLVASIIIGIISDSNDNQSVLILLCFGVGLICCVSWVKVAACIWRQWVKGKNLSLDELQAATKGTILEWTLKNSSDGLYSDNDKV
jgi:hypothetical protein